MPDRDCADENGPDQDGPDQDGEARAGGDILFRVDGGAAILRLNRPAKRNALSQDMWEAIRAALAEAAARPDVRAFVFTGLPGVFCAGADLSALKSDDRAAAARYREISLAGYGAVRDFGLPTVAVIDGLCIGGGNNLALACDIRLASPRASFAIPAVRHGIVYDRATVTRLVELMGSGRASHLLFTAGRIDAARAAETGLVDVLASDLDAELAAFLDALRAADMPTLLAIRDTIRQVR
jgi:enoyl-CoA hydratase/carnithine racemase